MRTCTQFQPLPLFPKIPPPWTFIFHPGRSMIGRSLLPSSRFPLLARTLRSPLAPNPSPSPPLPMRATSTQAASSHRIQLTDDPVISLTKQLIATAKRDVLSLAQGIVHWTPPPEALQRVSSALLTDRALHSYGQSNGDPKLIEALKEKLRTQNGLVGYDVQVTTGANQAFANLAVSLVDERDRTVLFAPYYFNHLMALQMTGGAQNVVFGKCDPVSLHIDLDWLEQECASPTPPKLVVVVNPCNPTGVLLGREELDRLADICKRSGSWLVLDNTYEDFLYEGRQHYCPSGDHILHIFSFSKAFGMMGYRLGYIAWPANADGGKLGMSLLKAQDTIAICGPAVSQRLALECLQPDGLAYIRSNIAALAENRSIVLEALSPLGTLGNGVAGGEGAIYLWARLPPSCSEGTADVEVVKWLINKHGICIIPGSSCGAPGFVRAAYGNLSADRTRVAAARLRGGLEELVGRGMEGVRQDLREMGFE